MFSQRRISPIARALIAGAAVFAVGTATQARPLAQRDLVALNRLGDAHLSPNGDWAVYDLTATDFEANKRKHAIYIVSTSGIVASHKLADGTSPRWSANGKAIYFLAPIKDVQQIWSINPAKKGASPQQVTSLPLDVDSFRLGADGKTLIVSLAVFPDADDPAATKARLDATEKRKAKGALYDKIFIRHWDTWADGRNNHLFALNIGADGRASGVPRALTHGIDGDVPAKPFGGEEDYALSPDAKMVYFSVRVAGKSEPWSTNFDIYAVPADASAAPRNLTAANTAWDAGPVPSPDGKWLAYRSMKRPGFEADRFGVMLMNLANGERREIDGSFDRSAGDLSWSGDGKWLYFTTDNIGEHPLYKMDAATGAAMPIVTGGHVAGFDVAAGGGLLWWRDALNSPAELFAGGASGEHGVQLTHANGAELGGVDFSPAEQFSFSGWNGETVYGYTLKPAGFRPGKRYPTVFLVHGGPQGSFGNSWSYLWNPQVWAGWGYGVVMVDFHGSTGYGQAFTDAISGHWGDRPLEDLKKGWEAAQAKYSWIDSSRACAAGASYGGFMIYWMAGNWSEPWKCLIDHDGVFDNRMMGYATEELWFSEWENGHTPVWENQANYERFNPINHVADWKVPMLVIHGAKDYRIPIEQGIAAFTALQRKGIESQFLTFPDENHWVLKAQNSLQWHDTVQAWLAKHLK